ncbi:hypothetical protein AB9E35_34180, partial [Rhizobium leguminosarum]
ADYNRVREKIEVVFPDFQDFNSRFRKPGGFRLTVAASDRRAGRLVHPQRAKGSQRSYARHRR